MITQAAQSPKRMTLENGSSTLHRSAFDGKYKPLSSKSVRRSLRTELPIPLWNEKEIEYEQQASQIVDASNNEFISPRKL